MSPCKISSSIPRSILKSLRERISIIVGNEIGSANEQQGLGYAVLILVLIISPCIIFLVRNATLTIQVFSLNLAKKAHELKVEKRKADKLLFQVDMIDCIPLFDTLYFRCCHQLLPFLSSRESQWQRRHMRVSPCTSVTLLTSLH